MGERRLRVDWPACKAHGVCAEVIPEMIELDQWGYPVLRQPDIPAELRGQAKRAVAACPTQALRLVAVPPA